MFSLFYRLVKFVFEAVYVYAASEQGHAELIGIANDAEADGIDIPFYEPSPSEAAARESSAPNSSSQSSYDDFLSRHPDIAIRGE